MMTITKYSLAALAFVPLVALGALHAGSHERAASAYDAPLPQFQLAVLKAEARQLVVHIDGP